MLDRDEPGAVAGVHVDGGSVAVRVTCPHHHSLLHDHRLHHLDQEQHAESLAPRIHTSQKLVQQLPLFSRFAFITKDRP